MQTLYGISITIADQLSLSYFSPTASYTFLFNFFNTAARVYLTLRLYRNRIYYGLFLLLTISPEDRARSIATSLGGPSGSRTQDQARALPDKYQDMYDYTLEDLAGGPSSAPNSTTRAAHFHVLPAWASSEVNSPSNSPSPSSTNVSYIRSDSISSAVTPNTQSCDDNLALIMVSAFVGAFIIYWLFHDTQLTPTVVSTPKEVFAPASDPAVSPAIVEKLTPTPQSTSSDICAECVANVISVNVGTDDTVAYIAVAAILLSFFIWLDVFFAEILPWWVVKWQLRFIALHQIFAGIHARWRCSLARLFVASKFTD